jgi:chlorobactene glucosyltransferase
VDDQSNDGTSEIARSLGARVISGAPLPPEWNGKNWACHQGAAAANGELLLFTDADTEHLPDSLSRAVDFLNETESGLISALPYHRTEKFWEKCLGPFFALLYTACNPFHPRPKRLFAIGQYLLFRRSTYETQGGHAAVAHQYPDDLALARACIKANGAYRVYSGPPLFNVRMYANLREFVEGWRRSFLAGIQQTRFTAVVEVVLAIWALTGGLHPFQSMGVFLAAISSAVLVWRRQKLWGRFSLFGIVFLPFSVGLYCLVTVLALWDLLNGNPLRWKGREYMN